MGLVQGRKCGACFACCKFMAIKTPGLEKPTNLLCPHSLKDQGCNVYSNRPEVCRSWFCEWRHLEGLSLHWRPDHSGLVIKRNRRKPDKKEITITILDETKLFLSREFFSFVEDLHNKGYIVMFHAVGPIGFFGTHVSINSYVEESIGNGDLLTTLSIFNDIFQQMKENFKMKPDGKILKSSLVP